MTTEPQLVIPADFSLREFVNGCISLPKPMRPLLLGMLELVQRNQPLAIACTVSVTDGGRYARLTRPAMRETISSFNQYAARRRQGAVRLVVHDGAVVAPTGRLAPTHVRYVNDPSEPTATLWLVPADSAVAGHVLVLAQNASVGSRAVRTDVPVYLFDAMAFQAAR